MWSDERDRDFAAEVARLILETMKEHGFKATKSKVYSNRKNAGGRVYITVFARHRTSSDEEYEEEAH